MLFGHLHRLFGLFKIRPSHHEFDTPRIYCSLKDTFKVVFVGLFSVVDAAKDGIAEVDANLEQVLTQS